MKRIAALLCVLCLLAVPVQGEALTVDAESCILMEKETGEVALAPHVTCRSSVIYHLAQTLLVHQVTPCTLVDVVQDWIG